MKFYLLGMLLLFTASITHAQLKGIVFRQDSTKNFPLENAKIRLIRANQGVFSNHDGHFELVLPKQLPDTIVVSAMGYLSDSIPVTKDDRFISLTIVLIAISTKQVTDGARLVVVVNREITHDASVGAYFG